MIKLASPYFWFRTALIAGLLLAMVLLVQSIAGYLHVSRQLIVQQADREAERQLASLEREVRRTGKWDLTYVKELLEEMSQDSPNKFAWIRVMDMTGHPTVQVGRYAEAPDRERNLEQWLRGRERASEVYDMEGREVLVSVLPFRIRRNRTGPPGQGRQGLQGPQATQRGTQPFQGSQTAQGPQTAQGSQSTQGTQPPLPGSPPGPRMIEIAVYADSLAAAFGPLRRDLIVNCLAALGLAASMMLLWFQFPRYVRGKQLEQQLELARHVQTDLLPSASPSFESWDIAASCLAAQQVGGDFYDVFLTDHHRMALVLGDVSGKGIPAALLMGLLHGAIRSIRWTDTALDHENSSRRLNDLLIIRTSPDRFASLFWGYYDSETHSLQYVNAGHLPPALIRRNGTGEFLIERLEEGGPILGAIPQANYRQGGIVLNPGDMLVLYSDGIVEATNTTGEEFGEERLWTVIRDNWNLPAAVVRDQILMQVRRFLGAEQAQDDMTLLVIWVGNGLDLHIEGPRLAGASVGKPLLPENSGRG